MNTRWVMNDRPIHPATGSDAGPSPDRPTSVHAATKERHPSDPAPSIAAAPKLTPAEPPGRATRKARLFSAEIGRLRTEGYTLAAIGRALAAAGLEVSLATIRRELKRPMTVPPARASIETFPIATSRVPAHPPPLSVPGTTAALSTDPAAHARPATRSDPPSGKALAEAFALSKNTNPLIRAKEKP